VIITASTTCSSCDGRKSRPLLPPSPPENEKVGLIRGAWFTVPEPRACADRLLPASLPTLLGAIVASDIPAEPLFLRD